MFLSSSNCVCKRDIFKLNVICQGHRNVHSNHANKNVAVWFYLTSVMHQEKLCYTQCTMSFVQLKYSLVLQRYRSISVFHSIIFSQTQKCTHVHIHTHTLYSSIYMPMYTLSPFGWLTRLIQSHPPLQKESRLKRKVFSLVSHRVTHDTILSQYVAHDDDGITIL